MEGVLFNFDSAGAGSPESSKFHFIESVGEGLK
jgi:hypothetical protein